MNPKKTTKWLTTGSVVLTFILLIIYIILIVIDAERFNGWLQILAIAIQLFASFIGVFLAIRMSQLISDKEEKDKVKDLWSRIGKFLAQLKGDIQLGKGLMELADYKSYWLSVQNASYESAKALHNDEKYMEISRIFSFLRYHENEWSASSHSIGQWKQNVGVNLRAKIVEWEQNIDDMISYIEKKTI